MCDQDDIWNVDKNEKILNCFENNKNILVINSTFEYIDAHDNLIKDRCDKNKSNHNLILFPLKEEITQIPLEVVVNKNISQK